MKKILSLLIFISSFSIHALEVELTNCLESQNPILCVGLALSNRLNSLEEKIDLIEQNQPGFPEKLLIADIDFYNNKNCTGDSATGTILSQDLNGIMKQCEDIANQYSRVYYDKHNFRQVKYYPEIDGLKINGTCYDIDNPGDYGSLSLLARTCTAKILQTLDK